MSQNPAWEAFVSGKLCTLVSSLHTSWGTDLQGSFRVCTETWVLLISHLWGNPGDTCHSSGPSCGDVPVDKVGEACTLT